MMRRLIRSLFIAVVLHFESATVSADELAQVKEAWHLRTNTATEFDATWELDVFGLDIPPGTPEDPETHKPLHRLRAIKEKVRHEWRMREYGYSATGPGKKGWRTTSFVEGFDPSSGWRLLVQSSEESITPSGTTNYARQTPRLRNLQGRLLLFAWYRPLDSTLFPVPFEAWRICSDEALRDPQEGTLTLQSESADKFTALLTLSKENDYLPVRLRSGFRQQPGQRLTEMTETEIVIGPRSANAPPIPATWNTRSYLPNGHVVVTDACRLLSLEFQCDEKTEFVVAFPSNAKLNDLALANQGIDASGTASTIARSRPFPISYLIAGFFVLVLTFLMFRIKFLSGTKE